MARAASRGRDPSAFSTADSVAPALLAWFAASKRDLPWRRTRDPYAIWLSEVMLQQTRVDTVLGYYARFLHAYPNVVALAEAPLDEVLGRWSGLGYYRRARLLHAAARELVHAHGGRLPEDAAALRAVKGIGPYTAGAVASIAFGKAEPLVDGNVARVLARIFAIDADVRSGRGRAHLWELARTLVSTPPASESPGDWNQALMELGATVCLPRTPRCGTCPAHRACEARKQGKIDVLPRVGKKKPLVPIARVALVASSRTGGVLLGRRTEGTFEAMWEPPSFDAMDELFRFARALGMNARHVERAGRVTHVLSHRRLEVEVFRAAVPLPARAARTVDPAGTYASFEIVAPGAMQGRGVATYAWKILAAAGLRM
jgi:A/G-specific adenine glycosylase